MHVGSVAWLAVASCEDLAAFATAGVRIGVFFTGVSTALTGRAGSKCTGGGAGIAILVIAIWSPSGMASVGPSDEVGAGLSVTVVAYRTCALLLVPVGGAVLRELLLVSSPFGPFGLGLDPGPSHGDPSGFTLMRLSLVATLK